MSKKSTLEKTVYDILNEEEEIQMDICTNPFEDPLSECFQEYQNGKAADDDSIDGSDEDEWDDEPFDDWYDNWIDDSIDDSDEDDVDDIDEDYDNDLYYEYYIVSH